jgi:hypothetical protein
LIEEAGAQQRLTVLRLGQLTQLSYKGAITGMHPQASVTESAVMLPLADEEQAREPLAVQRIFLEGIS